MRMPGRYSLVLGIGLAAGYGLALWLQPVVPVKDSQPQASVPVVAAPVQEGASPDNAAATVRVPNETMQQNTVESPAMTDPASQQSTVDETWLAFVEQQYPKRLQQDLSAFPDGVKQEMQAFQQTVVDADWAQATEQQLQDILITQQDLKFVQVERVQCRQDGCEIYGTSLAPTALDALDRQLRKFHSNHANTMIMDLTKPGADLGNFYMLVTGMKKD